MATFTFITDYQGGTYICQQTADDLHPACYLWKDHVVSGKYIPNLNTHQFSEAFETDMDDLPPVAIDEVSNVWIFQLLLGDDTLTVHIVQTDLSSSDVTVVPRSSRTPA
jgi:hypothetical protein